MESLASLELVAFLFLILLVFLLLLFFFLLLLGFHRFSFLVGAAGGAAVMMILCGILLICSRYVHIGRGHYKSTTKP